MHENEKETVKGELQKDDLISNIISANINMSKYENTCFSIFIRKAQIKKLNKIYKKKTKNLSQNLLYAQVSISQER